MDPTIGLLRDLVAIDSVNPSLIPGARGERGVADRIAAELRAVGVEVDLADIVPGRPNVVGVLEGRTPGRTLMLCGHTDTVGVEGMDAPFDPVERDGRIFGRGAQDMKGGLAAVVGAVRTIAASGGLASGRIIVAAVIDEEYASLGAEALVARWQADAAIVTEPTDLTIAVGHKGFAWVEIETEGRAAHGSRPAEGRDAILRMGRVLARLEALDGALQTGRPHPLLGTPSLHASRIAGGRELSVYPARCVAQVERRTVPGEEGGTALAEIQEVLAGLGAADPEFAGSARLLFSRPPYELPANHELPRLLGTALERAGRSARIGGMSFWTDAAILAGAGIPAVLFGPGGAGLHSREEYVRIDEVLACREALVALARTFC